MSWHLLQCERMASDPKPMYLRAYEACEDASASRRDRCYFAVSSPGHSVLPQSDGLQSMVYANQLSALAENTDNQIYYRLHPSRTCQASIVDHRLARASVRGDRARDRAGSADVHGQIVSDTSSLNHLRGGHRRQ